MSIYSPIVTLGLDPELSKIVTMGLGPDIGIEVTVIPFGTFGRGPTSRKVREEERIIRIRVIDEAGKVMMQERFIPEGDLKDITIAINENFTVSGGDIYVKIQEQQIKENTPTRISVKAHETRKRQPESNS